MSDVTISPGLQAHITVTVTEADTAIAFGSGSVPVLATPRVVALVEAAAVAAVAGRTPEGTTTVGTRIVLDHLVASPLGSQVTAHAEVASVDGRRTSFAVWVTMDGREVARGDHVRATVATDGFVR